MPAAGDVALRQCPQCDRRGVPRHPGGGQVSAGQLRVVTLGRDVQGRGPQPGASHQAGGHTRPQHRGGGRHQVILPSDWSDDQNFDL